MLTRPGDFKQTGPSQLVWS